MRTLFAILTAVACLPIAAPAQTQPAPQAYLEPRWDENWSYLRDHARRTDYFDPIKYIPLNDHGWYASIGGESRTRYELFRHATFGSAPETPEGFLIQRYLFHVDTYLG